MVKNPHANAGHTGSTPGSGRSPGEGNSNLLQYSSVASLWVRQLSVRLQCGRAGFNPWVGKIPWRRKWQPTPVLLPGESHGGRSLIGYSPWGRKDWDTTERLHFTSLHLTTLRTLLSVMRNHVFCMAWLLLNKQKVCLPSAW